VADGPRLADPTLIRDLVARIGVGDAQVIGRPIDPGVSDQPAAAVDPFAALARRALILERGWPDDLDASRSQMARWAREGVVVLAGPSGTSAQPARPVPTVAM
jgi:hypothetical protein